MIVEADKVVTFHYILRDEEGNTLEDSHASEPIVYLHGHGGMLVGIEEALLSKEAGDVFSVTLSPEKAYGERQETDLIRIPIKRLKLKRKPVKGQIIEIQTEAGPRSMVVAKVGKFVVDADVNHPFAGKTLSFDIEILEVRDASEEELEHGHTHGDH